MLLLTFRWWTIVLKWREHSGPECNRSRIVERFSSKMKEVCGELNIPLADNCPKAKKAFELQARGTVLGIGFNSSDLTWFLSSEKANKVAKRCLDEAKAHM